MRACLCARALRRVVSMGSCAGRAAPGLAARSKGRCRAAHEADPGPARAHVCAIARCYDDARWPRMPLSKHACSLCTTQGPGVKSCMVTLVIIVAPSLSFLISTCPRLLEHNTNPLWVMLVPVQLVRVPVFRFLWRDEGVRAGGGGGGALGMRYCASVCARHALVRYALMR